MVAALSTTTIKRGGDLKQTSAAATDLVLPQPVRPKFYVEKREYCQTITSFILDDH